MKWLPQQSKRKSGTCSTKKKKRNICQGLHYRPQVIPCKYLSLQCLVIISILALSSNLFHHLLICLFNHLKILNKYFWLPIMRLGCIWVNKTRSPPCKSSKAILNVMSPEVTELLCSTRDVISSTHSGAKTWSSI